jgi:threonine/homoserine efflux transporter RhtA
LTTGTLVVKQINVTSAAVTNITATRVGNSTSNFVEYSFACGNSTSFVYIIGAQTITGAINAPNTSVAGVAAAAVTAVAVLATANVIVAGTKFRTAYGVNVLGTTSPFTNTSVTLTAA